MAIQLAARDAWLIALLGASGLSDTAKLVGSRIALYLNLRDGRCDPSKQRLASSLGLGVRTVDRAVIALVDAGWVTVATSKGRKTHNYALIRPPHLAHSNPVTADGVEGSNPAKSGTSTPSQLWRGNIEENITPLTPHGGGSGDHGKELPRKVAVARSDAAWPAYVDAMRRQRRQPSWTAPTTIIDVGRGPEPGWFFDPALLAPPRAGLRLVTGGEPP